MKGLNTQYANTASCIRNGYSAIIRLLNTDLLDPEKRKAKFHGCIVWVPNKSGGGTYSDSGVSFTRITRGSMDFSQPGPDGGGCLTFLLLPHVDTLLSSLLLPSVGPPPQRTSCLGTRHITHRLRPSPTITVFVTPRQVPLPRAPSW